MIQIEELGCDLLSEKHIKDYDRTTRTCSTNYKKLENQDKLWWLEIEKKDIFCSNMMVGSWTKKEYIP